MIEIDVDVDRDKERNVYVFVCVEISLPQIESAPVCAMHFQENRIQTPSFLKWLT